MPYRYCFVLGRGFGGGIALLSGPPSKPEFSLVWPYAGARDIRQAGAERLYFDYQSLHGSEQFQERGVVFCGLAEDAWIPCFDLVTNQRFMTSGYPATDASAQGMFLQVSAKVSLHGDTLVLVREEQIKRYGQALQRRTLGEARFRLP